MSKEDLLEEIEALRGYKHMYRVLEQQNKRYRERLEYLLAEAKDHKAKGLRIQHWALIKDLEDALEGEE